VSDDDDGKFMQQVVSVEYDMKPSPEQIAYGQELAKHRIVGHRCPECDLTYVPGNGFCPLCSVAIGGHGRVELEPRGTVTTFTVVEPVQYQGQHEKSPYVVAAILLDGAGVALGQQRLGESQIVRMGGNTLVAEQVDSARFFALLKKLFGWEGIDPERLL